MAVSTRIARPTTRRRTRRLEAEGYAVLRFWNNEVLGNTDGVVCAIADWLGARTPRW